VFQIGDLGPGKYKLVARGLGGVEFENSTDLTYVHKSYSVFVQTDRGVYKPGHIVKYRIVVLSPHLKPSVTTPIDIHVTVRYALETLRLYFFTSCALSLVQTLVKLLDERYKTAWVSSSKVTRDKIRSRVLGLDVVQLGVCLLCASPCLLKKVEYRGTNAKF